MFLFAGIRRNVGEPVSIGRNVSMLMWLPTPIYERVPQFYFLAGLLFITDGLYLGFDRALAFYYIAFGLVSCTYSIGLYLMRRHYRRKRDASHPEQCATNEIVDDGSPMTEESIA